MTRKTLQQIIDENPEAETFRYGDSERLSREILALVRSGKKTATVEAMRVYRGKGADALPEVGRRDVALEWNGLPALMVETVAVSIRRFDEMDEAFVAAQGEFRDLDHWRKAYRAYFARTGGVSDDMEIMCEEFRVVEDYAQAPASGAAKAPGTGPGQARPVRGPTGGPSGGAGPRGPKGPPKGPARGPASGRGNDRATGRATGRASGKGRG